MIRALTVIMAAAYGLTAQTGDGLELWARVRQHVRASVTGLANYSCQETMDRSIYAPTGPIEFRERLRLEVLFTEATELFAWPGSPGFTSEPLESWIGGGAIATGNFVAQLHNLFVLSSATVRYAGLDTRDGHSMHRFDFHAPLLSSRYTLTVQGKSAITAYSGSFWVDQQSLDLVLLETRAEEIPRDLDCGEARESVTYGRIRLGVGERLLPSAAELALVSREGRKSRNTIAFSRCRRYTAETSLSFTPPSGPIVTARTRPERELPADVPLVLRLEQPISIGESAAGDRIVATLDKPVSSGAVLLPKGTRVVGRIRRLEQHFTSPPSILVGLQFLAAEASDGPVAVRARLTGPRSTPDVIRTVNNRLDIERGNAGLDIQDDGTSTGVASFRVSGKELRLQRGFRTFWETH